jgi:hypothetical protein
VDSSLLLTLITCIGIYGSKTSSRKIESVAHAAFACSVVSFPRQVSLDAPRIWHYALCTYERLKTAASGLILAYCHHIHKELLERREAPNPLTAPDFRPTAARPPDIIGEAWLRGLKLRAKWRYGA